MHCSDLERYLEACLEGNLGRGRLALLKRHVAGCRACHGRIERLRGFERDLHRRFRCMEDAPCLWAPLEMSLVEQGYVGDDRPQPLPPPRASGAAEFRLPVPAVVPEPPRLVGARRAGLWRFVAGFGLVLAGLVAFADLIGGDGDGAALTAYRGLIDRDQGLEIPAGDAARLDGWFRLYLGADPPAVPLPAEARLLGAAPDPEGVRAALLLYDVEGVPAVLRVVPAGAGQVSEAATAEALDDGLSEARWTDGRFRYAVVSALPPATLLAFADG